MWRLLYNRKMVPHLIAVEGLLRFIIWCFKLKEEVGRMDLVRTTYMLCCFSSYTSMTFILMLFVSFFFAPLRPKFTETSIFGRVAHVCQLLPCVVVKVEDDKKDGKGSKRIWLSLRLSLVHKGLSFDAIQEAMVNSLYFYLTA